MGKSSRKSRQAKADVEGGTRAEARRRSRVTSAEAGGLRAILERYRLLVATLVVVGVAVVGYMAFSSTTATAYSCDSLLQAPPSQVSEAAGGEIAYGFPTPNQGAEHSEGSVKYGSCPPTSGEHRAGGALSRDFYGPATIQVPNDWVHNLEHGYAVIAYKGEPEQEVLDGIREAMDSAEPSEVAAGCGLPNKVIAVRFDDLGTPFAVLAWKWAYLMDEFDQASMTAAATQFQDMSQAPERAC